MSAGSSEVETTTKAGGAKIVLQEFLDLPAPLATSPITEMSAETLRASIDKRTDLPTPEPEKMPIRWPRHTVMNVFRARTPKIQRIADPPPRVSRRRRRTIRIGRRTRRQRPLAVDRLGSSVDDAAQPALRRPNCPGGGGNNGPAATAYAIKRGERHCKRMTAGEANHLAGNLCRSGLDRQACTN